MIVKRDRAESIEQKTRPNLHEHDQSLMAEGMGELHKPHPTQHSCSQVCTGGGSDNVAGTHAEQPGTRTTSYSQNLARAGNSMTNLAGVETPRYGHRGTS